MAGCTADPGFRGVPDVREAEAGEVASCAYVANISMTPGTYGLLADQGLKYARNKIKEDARSAGANTVVFDKVTPGSDIYEVRATAYRC
jgi:hypothetical protein